MIAVAEADKGDESTRRLDVARRATYVGKKALEKYEGVPYPYTCSIGSSI